MSTSIITESVVVSAAAVVAAAWEEGDMVKCACCGLTEECTEEYIERIRERYKGQWICGLCAEAVKDEIVRSERLISAEEALNRHLNFCKKFRFTGPPPDPVMQLIGAMKQILRRSSESPRFSSSPAGMIGIGVGVDLAEGSIPALGDHSMEMEGGS
ncbi:unnamed protein product [Cuscuta europaea]|uniref:DUF1677 family protein n=1 Tax=Cuscuta europaea TaxID=41803 RepID=A0A9P0ZX97_CUSEU|nr:unnamed protein product [Cuscuta europaea]